MNIYRIYKDGEFGPWKMNGGTLQEKIHQQRLIKRVMEEMREARLNYYSDTPHGHSERQVFERWFTVHQRKGYQIHELKTESRGV